MNIAPAITAAIAATPPDQRQVDIERLTRKVVHTSAVRLANIAKQMLVERQLPQECVRLIFAGIAEDLRGAPAPAPRRKKFSRKDLDRASGCTKESPGALRRRG